jgi:hypothetical protein
MYTVYTHDTIWVYAMSIASVNFERRVDGSE